MIIVVFFGCQSSNVKKESPINLTSTFKQKSSNRILFVVSNQKTYGNTTLKTANHFGEIVYAYEVLVDAGYKIDFVSPQGGEVLLGYIDKTNKIQQKYLEKTDFFKSVKETRKKPKRSRLFRL